MLNTNTLRIEEPNSEVEVLGNLMDRILNR